MLDSHSELSKLRLFARAVQKSEMCSLSGTSSLLRPISSGKALINIHIRSRFETWSLLPSLNGANLVRGEKIDAVAPEGRNLIGIDEDMR